MNLLKRLKPLTQNILLFLVVIALSACTSFDPPNNFELEFSPRSETGLVIGGIELDGLHRSYAVFLKQIDPSTQKIIPDGGEISIFDGDLPKVREIRPGTYAVTSTAADTGFVRVSPLITHPPQLIITHYVTDNSLNFLGGCCKSDASVKGMITFRVKINPGEIVYLGHFLINELKWDDQRKEVQKVLRKFENVQGELVFRPPEYGFKD